VASISSTPALWQFEKAAHVRTARELKRKARA